MPKSSEHREQQPDPQTVPPDAALDTDPAQGLAQKEAAKRLAKWGPNALEKKPVSIAARLLKFFWGPIPWMIEVAAGLSAAVGHWEEFAIIAIMLVINSGLGFWEEFNAGNAIEALKGKLALRAKVLRAGSWQDIDARELVPGDVVQVQIGNIVPADMKLVQGDYLEVDQSALTGESLPVGKAPGDDAYSGSVVKAGAMTGIVTATGANTYFGHTATLVGHAGAVSHFQQAVIRIGDFLILTTIGLVALILMTSLYRDMPLVDTILFALVLTIAAIPVAMPAVLSVTMAVGASRLARLGVIVSRLTAIEEMAGADILCTDKTGTLTQNRIVVRDPIVFDGGNDNKHDLILAAALASRPSDTEDAIESAIFTALGDAAQLAPYRVLEFHPFDPVAKRATARVTGKGTTFEVTKGALQVILPLCAPKDSERAAITAKVDALAAAGYRILAVARRAEGEKWHFLGLLPLFDPPRPEAREMIGAAMEEGLGVRMVTGDNVAIAREMSRDLGLGPDIISASDVFGSGTHLDIANRIERADGFAEVFPEHKYSIVRQLQSRHHIIAMTGDGVNDAPALKQADVGIAVNGATDAARAAADLVLTRPGLSVILTGIDEARRIFERMTSYAIFRISETIRVLLFMTLSILVFNFYPVTAIMIVLLSVLNDFPIMMIAYDNVLVADHPVRWDMERVLVTSSVLGVLGVIASFTLFWFVDVHLGLPRNVIQTLIFLKLLVAGHTTLYVTRNKGWFFQRPWPRARMFLTLEATQVLGTLAAVYGWGMHPIGWQYALAIWAYALVWFPINNAAKILVYAMMRRWPERRPRPGPHHESRP